MWSTIGQDHLLRPLSASLRAGRLAHAYLLTGPPHVGKMTLAIDLAAAVNCTGGGDAGAGPCGECAPCARIGRGVHADVRVVSLQQREAGQPTRTRIGIDEVREAMQATSLRSVEGGWTVIIFDGAETFSPEAANALLKTLEEPPDQVLILLLTANEDAILPTVRSRCRLLPLRPMGGAMLTEFLVNRHGVETDQARWLSRLARGCPGWAVSVLADPTILEERAEALDFIAASATTPLDERFAYANSLAGVYSRDRETVRQTLFLWQRLVARPVDGERRRQRSRAKHRPSRPADGSGQRRVLRRYRPFLAAHPGYAGGPGLQRQPPPGPGMPDAGSPCSLSPDN